MDWHKLNLTLPPHQHWLVYLSAMAVSERIHTSWSSNKKQLRRCSSRKLQQGRWLLSWVHHYHRLFRTRRERNGSWRARSRSCICTDLQGAHSFNLHSWSVYNVNTPCRPYPHSVRPDRWSTGALSRSGSGPRSGCRGCRGGVRFLACRQMPEPTHP